MVDNNKFENNDSLIKTQTKEKLKKPSLYKVLILNDPARGIDVSTKRDLYVHLRNFVEEGNTVIFLSSELEEFIGLCPKVIVFRNGTVFDIFEND